MTLPLHIEVRDSLSAIDPHQWNALCCDGNPFLRHEFLHTLDSTGCLGQSTGWYPRYFLLWQGEQPGEDLLGAVPAYIKTNSYGEFVFDWAWAEAFERHQLDYYPKLVSSIPFTPATGRRLLVRKDQPFRQHASILASALRQFAAAEGYSGVHYLFVTQEESELLCAVKPPGSKQIRAKLASTKAQADKDGDTSAPSDAADEEHTDPWLEEHLPNDHLQRIDCQYHWHNAQYNHFDDFLARCTSKRRKTIRRERRYVTDAGIRLQQRLGESLSDQEWAWVHALYQSTYDRKWGNPSLTESFFKTVGQLMGDKVLIVLAYDDKDSRPEEPIACSIMFIGATTLYGRYWGCRRDVHSLHFEACYYQGIEYCIAHEIPHFEPGAQGEHKITRGFVPTITRSAHHIRHPDFRDAIAHFLHQEKQHVEHRCAGLTDLLPFKSDTLSL